MTSLGRCGTISKLSERQRKCKLEVKKLEKSSKTPLTNGSVYDIIYRLPTSGEANSKGTAKKLQKSLKNLLTKASGCDIINKLLTNGKRITKLIEN